MYSAKPPTRSWRTVAVDVAGPFITSRNGSKHVLVFVDQFTKWVEVVPMRDQLASTVAQAFYTNVICRYGCPEYLLFDRWPSRWHFGKKKIFSSAYTIFLN
jgi:hypothetical protein